mgnify:CR=1 FL=1
MVTTLEKIDEIPFDADRRRIGQRAGGYGESARRAFAGEDAGSRRRFAVLAVVSGSFSLAEAGVNAGQQPGFELLDKLKEQGITSIMISHKLNEITEVSDRVTVIRDGKTIETIAKLSCELPNEDPFFLWTPTTR